MPWKVSSEMDEGLRFISRILEGEAMTDLCLEFGISRKTGYKLYQRYKECGSALNFEFNDDGSLQASAEIWPLGNKRTRIARMQAVLIKLVSGNWPCRWCGEPVPIYRRADVCYCCERCRKKSASQRRAAR